MNNRDIPSFRRDPLTDRWVIIAKQRSKRPLPLQQNKCSTSQSSQFCPFCKGQEQETPTSIRTWHLPGSQNAWDVRVFPNKYPALIIEAQPFGQAEGLYDKFNGFGAHEVIVEGADHYHSIADMPEELLPLVMKAWRERLVDLSRDRRFKSAIVFKNHKAEAGASVEHTHSQLIALPMLSKQHRDELQGAQSYYKCRQRCLFCDIRDQEIKEDQRVIAQTPNVLAFMPYASRFPFETWIMPKVHQPYFEHSSDALLEDVAHVLHQVIKKITVALDDPAFNLFVRSAPFAHADEEFSYLHWHIEIIPKLTHIAGFEWATGYYINPTPPEEAARHLKSITNLV